MKDRHLGFLDGMLKKPKRLPAGRATGRRRTPGRMNKMEQSYALHLEGDPHVAWWMFEAIKLKLADNTFYEPDFLVMLDTDELQVHEVKGHWEDDARVKIKVAASLFPFVFIAVTRPKSAMDWQFEEISSAGRRSAH